MIPTIMNNDEIGQQKTKHVFPFAVLKTHKRLWLLLFCSTAKKTCFSHETLEADYYGIGKQKTKQDFPSSY